MAIRISCRNKVPHHTSHVRKKLSNPGLDPLLSRPQDMFTQSGDRHENY